MKLSKKIGVTGSYFGTLVGAGVASGVVSVVFFVLAAGYFSPFMVVFTYASQAFIYFVGTEIARRYDVNSINGIFTVVYGKAGKVMGIVADLLIDVILACALATVFAGAGSHGHQLLNWPYLIGVLATAAVSIVVALLRLDAFEKTQTVMSVLMIVIVFMIYGYALVRYSGEGLKMVYETKWLGESGSFWNGIYYSLMITSGQIGILPVFLMFIKEFKSVKDTASTCTMCFVVATIINLLLTMPILAFVPEILGVDLAGLYLITDVMSGPMATIAMAAFTVFMLLAYITTGGSHLACLMMSVNEQAKKMKIYSSLFNIVVTTVIAIILIPLSVGSAVDITYKLMTPVDTIAFFILTIPMLLRAPVLFKRAKNGNPLPQAAETDKPVS